MTRLALALLLASACAATAEKPDEVHITLRATETATATATAMPVATPSATATPMATTTAQPAVDAALAEQLFTQGRELMSAGLVAEACLKFEQSFAIDQAIGTLLNMASCHERSGRTIDACGGYRRVQQIARGKSDARERFAAEKANALGCPP